MIYLGSLGRMVGVACPAEQRSSTADRYSFQTTLGGRVKAQVRPEGRRTWDLRLPRTSTSSDVAVLQAFADGSWGPGPFRFVPAEAPSTNLLPPRVAACDSSENPSYLVVDGGPVQVDGQWFAQSYFNTADVVIFFGKDYESGAVPVDAGQRVTASAFVAGNNSRVRVTFYDQHGDSLGSSYGSSAGSGTAFRRSVVTAVPPAGAVAARLFAVDTSRATGPAMTWTDGAGDWSDGRGCAHAVVLKGQSDLIRTGLGGRTYEGVSFTVQEVG